MSSAPKSDGILETSLYVESVPKSVEFYERIFGFHVISDFGARGCAMQAGPHQVLLIFQKNGSRAISTPHHGDGELHLAFAIPASELPVWEAWLAQNDIPIEERTTWKKGGQSLYFRDPDRHLLELATPGVWEGHWTSRGRRPLHWLLRSHKLPPSFDKHLGMKAANTCLA